MVALAQFALRSPTLQNLKTVHKGNGAVVFMNITITQGCEIDNT